MDLAGSRVNRSLLGCLSADDSSLMPPENHLRAVPKKYREGSPSYKLGYK